MKWHDITLNIAPNMVVWPGDPKVMLDRRQKIEEGAIANVSQISMGMHTGTHVDAPYHFLEKGANLAHIPLDRFFGPVTVIAIPDSIGRITAETLDGIEPAQFTERVLFKTRNSQSWSRKVVKFDPDYTAIEEDGARFLVERGVRLVGIDALSIAPFRKGKPTHEVLLANNVVILEGINLENIPAGKYQLYCLPLKVGEAEGAPARAILIENP